MLVNASKIARLHEWSFIQSSCKCCFGTSAFVAIMTVVAWLRYHLIGRKKRVRAISSVVLFLAFATLVKMCRPRKSSSESLGFDFDWPDFALSTGATHNDKIRILPMSESSLTADWLYNTTNGSFWLPNPPSGNLISGFESRMEGNEFDTRYYKNRSGFIHPNKIDILMAQSTGFNAGDFYAIWIAPMVAGRPPSLPNDEKINKCSLATVGSILEWGARYVWGPGFISGNRKLARETEKVFAIRGPKSYKIATESLTTPDTQSVTQAYGDPGLLISWYYQPHNQTKTYSICLIPHYAENDAPALKDIVTHWSNVHVLNMRNPIFSIMDEIVQCEFVFSSSLHGLIFSDSYGIPNAHMNLTTGVTGAGFKFGDYYEAINRTYMSLDLINRTTVKFDEIKEVMEKSDQASNINLLPLWQNAPMHAEAYNRTRKQHLDFARDYVKRFSDTLLARPKSLGAFFDKMGIEH